MMRRKTVKTKLNWWKHNLQLVTLAVLCLDPNFAWGVASKVTLSGGVATWSGSPTFPVANGYTFWRSVDPIYDPPFVMMTGAVDSSTESRFYSAYSNPVDTFYAIYNSATDSELVAAGASWNTDVSLAIYNSSDKTWTWTDSYHIGSALPPPSVASMGGRNAAVIDLGNNIVDLMVTARSTEADLVNQITNTEFRFTSAFTPCTNAKQRSTWEHALHALEASGPLNLVKGQTRVWLCGYKSGGRVQTLPSNPGYHSSNVGALMGTEYRSLQDKWTVGLLLGTVVGKQTQATVRETFTNSKGFNYGVYGSISPIDGLRFDAVLTNLNMVLNHQRYDPASNQTAYAKYKMNTLIGDVMASYTWKLPRDYSVRFNLGNTYVGNHADGFTESGASVNFMQKSSTLKIHEVYGGLGLRKGWMVDKLLWRLTGSYEIGRQYYHKGRAIQVSYLGGTPITITNGPLRLNHYLNANLSVLQEAIGLKGVLAYTATLSPKAKTQGKSIRQMVSVKCELRF